MNNAKNALSNEEAMVKSIKKSLNENDISEANQREENEKFKQQFTQTKLDRNDAISNLAHCKELMESNERKIECLNDKLNELNENLELHLVDANDLERMTTSKSSVSILKEIDSVEKHIKKIEKM